MENLYVRERRFLLACLFVLGLLALYVTYAYLSWALLGLILARIVQPVHEELARRSKHPAVAAGFVVVLVAVAVTIPLVAFGYAVAGDIADLAASLGDQGLPAAIEDALSGVVGPETAARYSESLARQLESFTLELAPALVREALDVAVGVFVLGSVLFGVLVRRRSFYAWVRRILPLEPNRERRLLEEVGRGVDAVVYGIVVVAVIQALIGGLLWWIAGLHTPVFWTFVIFVVSMIPALGPSLVIFPAGVYAYLAGNVTGAILLLVGGGIVILVIDVYLRPAFIAKKGGMDSSLVLLAVMGGIVTLGPVGVFAGPLVLSVFLHVVHLVNETHAQFGGEFSND